MKRHSFAPRLMSGAIAAVIMFVSACGMAQEGEPPTPEEMLPQLARLYEANPNDAGVAVLYAETAVRTGDPGLAVRVYEKALASNPDNQLIRLRLIQVQELAGETAKAEQTRQDYIAALPDRSGLAALPGQGFDAYSPVPSTPLARDVYASAEIRPGFRMNGRLAAGILYDSNANQGPASDSMSLGDFTNVYIPGAGATETAGAYISGGFEFIYRPCNFTGWEWVGDIGFNARFNANSSLSDTNNRSSEWGRVAAGVRWSNEMNLFDLRLKAEIYDYQFESNAAAFGPEAVYIRALNENVQLISRAGIEWRDHSQASYRNGWYGHAGEYLRLFLGAPLEDGRRHQLTVGGRYLGGDAKDRNLDYDGWEARASFAYQLPCRVEVTPFAQFGQEYYRGPGTALESEKRRDDRLTAGIGAAWEFRKNWVFEAGYQYTKNWSKSNLYEYDRHVVTTGIAYGF